MNTIRESQRLTAAEFDAAVKHPDQATKEYTLYLRNGRAVDVEGVAEDKEYQAVTDSMGDEIWNHAAADFNARESERVEVLFRVHKNDTVSRVTSLTPCAVTVQKITVDHPAVTRQALRLGLLPPGEQAQMEQQES